MHSSSRAELIINESDIDDVFQSIYAKIIQGRLIDSVIGHIISISKYNPLTGGNYIKLPKELDHPRKILIVFKILMIMNALNGVWSDI